MNFVLNTKVPHLCHGVLYERASDDEQSGTYPVSIYSSPMGPIPRLDCHLAFSPASQDNYKAGDIVSILVMFQWQMTPNKSRFVGVDHDGTHVIIGHHAPAFMFDTTLVYANSDIAGLDMSYTNKKKNAGVLIGAGGDVHIVTPSYVKQIMTPYGYGTDQHSHAFYAQNFWRRIINANDDYTAVDHVGLTFGNSDGEQLSNASAARMLYYARRSFTPQSMDSALPKWVSTNEGTWCPFVGPNNNSYGLKKTKDILFSKIIHNFDKRITITAGEKGAEFLCMRIDAIQMAEKVMPSSPRAAPAVPGPGNFYLAINESGEITMLCGDDSGKPCISFKTLVDGSVELQSVTGVNIVGNFTVNGKRVLTEDFMNFFQKHQADITQTVAIGSPAPMSPAAVADFTNGVAPANFMTDVAAPVVLPPNSSVLSSI